MTGHSPHHEAPERVADQVNKFVENVAAVYEVMSHTRKSRVVANDSYRTHD